MILYSTCGQSRQLTSPLAPAMKKARYGKQRERERELKVWSDFWGTLLVIHAVTHEAIHSLCSCAGHMFNMISQHLPCPWKFLLLLFFSTEPSRPLLSCQFAGGVVLTQRQVHVLVTLLFPECLRISLRLESARTVRHKNVFQSHVFILQWASQCDGVAVIHAAYLCCLEVSTARC